MRDYFRDYYEWGQYIVYSFVVQFKPSQGTKIRFWKFYNEIFKVFTNAKDIREFQEDRPFYENFKFYGGRVTPLENEKKVSS